MKHALLAVLVLLVCARPCVAEDAWPIHAALVAFNAAQGADLASSFYAIGSEHAHEANPAFAPLARYPVAAGAVKMAIAGTTALTLWKLHAKHPALAVSLALAGTVGYGALAVHNAHLTGARP